MQPDDEPRPHRRVHEPEIHEALQRLARRGWTRLASGAGSRAAKYRQLFDEALGLADDEAAILCVLMLRGPQTPGELNQRTGRLHPFSGLDEIHAVLDRLARDATWSNGSSGGPGQKEERYRHLLGGGEGAIPADTPDRGDRRRPRCRPAGLAARVAALEAEVAELREAVALLRAGADAG